MSIQTILNTALYTRLTGTSLGTLTAGGTAAPSVFFEQAPDNQALPYVVWSLPSEVESNDNPHRMKEVIVRAYGVASGPAQAGTLDSAIDALLHGSALTLGTPWSNLWLMRENGYQLETVDEKGARYYTSGADYRAIITNG